MGNREEADCLKTMLAKAIPQRQCIDVGAVFKSCSCPCTFLILEEEYGRASKEFKSSENGN